MKKLITALFLFGLGSLFSAAFAYDLAPNPDFEKALKCDYQRATAKGLLPGWMNVEAAAACRGSGAKCSASYQCCSNDCNDGFCTGGSCKGAGSKCRASYECCGNNICDDGFCSGDGCRGVGAKCDASYQCCSGYCDDGFCHGI